MDVCVYTVYTYVCVYTYMYVCIYMYVCVYVNKWFCNILGGIFYSRISWILRMSNTTNITHGSIYVYIYIYIPSPLTLKPISSTHIFHVYIYTYIYIPSPLTLQPFSSTYTFHNKNPSSPKPLNLPIF